ncbi:hypothetical protein L6164_033189 [Bauhinia variegata]|uniref:Uncharacterized protein n=1 Tax=Bauhinia variegata TaxID=167791 RepID=A0ACB9KRG7_BAUVA|nr:hypothetical protein L6164_033189 [Bauhinia variegata]
MEVICFSASASITEINNPIKSWNCRNKTTGNAVDLRGSPFVYSQTLNKFYAIGCNSLVLLNSNGTKVGGCVSVCDDNNDEANFETSDGFHGSYCCETSLPYYLKEFNTTVEILGDNPNPNSTVTVSDDQCNCALIAFEGFLSQLPYTYNGLVYDLTFSGSASAYLEWEITDSSLQLPNSNNYCYKTNSTSSNKKNTGRRCRCNDGFGGNTYISEGCTAGKMELRREGQMLTPTTDRAILKQQLSAAPVQFLEQGKWPQTTKRASGLAELDVNDTVMILRLSRELSGICAHGYAHEKTMELLNILSSYSWHAKVALALSGFAVNFGKFCLSVQPSAADALSMSLAQLRELPNLGELYFPLKCHFDKLKRIVRASLNITKCIAEIWNLSLHYISEDKSNLSNENNALIHDAVYWTIKSVVTCSSQIDSIKRLRNE